MINASIAIKLVTASLCTPKIIIYDSLTFHIQRPMQIININFMNILRLAIFENIF